MISICIPAYNCNVTELVEALALQIDRIDGPKPEILVGDDGSDKAYQEQYDFIKDIRHNKVLLAPQNSGRSKIRNWIASHAKFNYLLFIDGDCSVKSDDYIQKYLLEASKQKKVVLGGINYSEILDDPRHILRWKYGHERESKIDYLKQEMSFLSSNFLVEKSTFEQFGFDESFKAYGHEDSLLGLSLRSAGIPITQIDNPVLHAGLEPGLSFIEKTKSSIENLGLLSEKIEGMDIRKKSVLLKIQEKELNPLLLFLGNTTYQAGRNMILKNLLSQKPSLFVFDLFKLFYLIHLKYERMSSSKN